MATNCSDGRPWMSLGLPGVLPFEAMTKSHYILLAALAGVSGLAAWQAMQLRELRDTNQALTAQAKTFISMAPSAAAAVPADSVTASLARPLMPADALAVVTSDTVPDRVVTDDASITPVVYIPIVGNILVPLAGVPLVLVALAVVALVILVGMMGWLVFGRYVLNDTPTWAEALALLLVLYMTSLGVAVASPLVNPQGMELICSGSGAIKVLLKTDDGARELRSHTPDCPLCVQAGSPLPVVQAQVPAPHPLSHALQPIVAADIAWRTAAPLPARGPPESS